MYNNLMKKQNEMKNSNKKGFTLIELIVVIAILAILALLAVPAYNGVKDKAAQQVAEANARSVYTAAMAVQATEGADSLTDAEKFAKDTVKMLTGNADTDEFSSGAVTATLEGGKLKTITWTGTINGYSYAATADANGTISSAKTKAS